jgi:plastocyanin
LTATERTGAGPRGGPPRRIIGYRRAVLATALHIGTPLLAAAGEPSKTPFYIAGGVLVAWAVLVAFLGLSRPDFPGTAGGARAVMAISVILVLGATSMAVATSAKKKHGASTQATSSAAPAAGGASTTLSLAADPANQLKYDKTSLTAPAGAVKIDFTNQSQTSHNVTIVDAGGTKVASTPTIVGSSTTLSVNLKAGIYTYYCSVDSHRQFGMKGTLTVQ